MAKLVKGQFHIYFGNGLVSFFIKEDAELQSLINTKHTINAQEVEFKKYVQAAARYERNNLLLKISSISTQQKPFDAETLKVPTRPPARPHTHHLCVPHRLLSAVETHLRRVWIDRSLLTERSEGRHSICEADLLTICSCREAIRGCQRRHAQHT